MQLGTRWTSGEEPPKAVPPALRTGIEAVDATIPADPFGQPRPRWTLTWLEGMPIAELDTGIIVSLDENGVAVARNDPEDGFG